MAFRRVVLFLVALFVGLAPFGACSDAGQCSGTILSAASHLAGAGLQIAASTNDCGQKAKGTATCAYDVGLTMRALSHTSRLLTEASGYCGSGKASGCGVAIQETVRQLSAVIATGSKASIDGKAGSTADSNRDLSRMAVAFGNTIRSLRDSVSKCSNTTTPSQVVKATGYYNTGTCVAGIFSAGTQIAAAGLEIAAAQKDCGKSTVRCAAEVGRSIQDFTTVGSYLADASDNCGAKGNAECGRQIQNVFVNTSAIVAASTEAKIAFTNGMPNKARKRLEEVGLSVKGIARAIGGTVDACARGAGPDMAYRDCIGDSLSAITYLATGAFEISVSTKECDKSKSTRAQCVSDVFVTLQSFARTATGIMSASDDCRGGSAFDMSCGTNVGNVFTLLSTLGQLGAHMQVDQSSATGEDKDDRGLGDTLQQFAIALSKSAQTCNRTPKTAAASALFAATGPLYGRVGVVESSGFGTAASFLTTGTVAVVFAFLAWTRWQLASKAREVVPDALEEEEEMSLLLHVDARSHEAVCDPFDDSSPGME